VAAHHSTVARATSPVFVSPVTSVLKPLCILWLAALAALASRGGEGVWQPTTWRGEEAYESRSGGWHAIVSVARARLVHFGATADDRNLLFETATRDHPQGWGGHRVWLGPQGTWPSGWWPPPPEWESTAAERATVREDVLELPIRPAGHGWPRWTRTYHWEGDALVCGV